MHIDLCGFESNYDISKIDNGKYEVYINLINKRDNVNIIIKTNENIKINK